MDWTAIIAMALALILIGFFSGIEMAFISASKLSVELKKKQGNYSGRIWAVYIEKPARFIGTTLISLNILLVIYGLLWSDILAGFWKFWGINNFYIKLIAETCASTFILLFFEFIFKAFFRAKGNVIISSSIITFIVQFFYSMFAWIAAFFVDVAEWILKYIFNVKLANKKELFTKIDLENFIKQTKAHDTEENIEMNNELFENVLSFSDVKVREC